MAKTMPIVRIPTMWDVESWPVDIFPYSPSRARYMLRVAATRDELIAVGALVRPGKNLQIIGAPFLSWMQRKAERGVAEPERARTRAAVAARAANVAERKAATAA